ncbi:MAG: hypothetical protein QNJ38_10985 [Prochloraceae cyanobacterium]|nr:hypothetical protein [Prochloraceae cyanobacterium]
MANSNPITDHLVTPFPRLPGADEPCARTPVQVKIPQSHYEKWMSLPSNVRNQYLREAIAKKIQEEFDLEDVQSA